MIFDLLTTMSVSTRRRIRAAFAVLLTAAAVASCSAPATTQQSTPDSTTPPAVTDTSAAGLSSPSPAPSGAAAAGDLSELVQVDGREIHLECRRSGSPTIVLQSGYGNAADIWHVTTGSTPAVFEGAAQVSRVCAYDRPGSLRQFDDTGAELATLTEGRSDTAPMPRTGLPVVTELHDLLAAADVPGPYLLVGHSLGGLFNLFYAQTYPDQVAGLVFVDATYPDLESALDPAVSSSFAAPLAQPSSPIAGYDMEGYDLGAMITEIESAPGAPPVPAAFLFADRIDSAGDQAFDQAYAAVLPELRDRFVARFPNATSFVVPDTTHYIQVERPDAVIEAIANLLAR